MPHTIHPVADYLQDELMDWLTKALFATAWLITGTVLLSIQFVLAGQPVGWFSWLAAILIAAVAPLHVGFLAFLFWEQEKGDGFIRTLIIIWIVWAFTPALTNLASICSRLIGWDSTSEFLFAWRYEMPWIIVLVIAVALTTMIVRDKNA